MVTNKKDMLNLASRLAEFGEEGVINKVVNVLKGIIRRTQYEDIEDKQKYIKSKFAQMLVLYSIQSDILGGGERLKTQMRAFIENSMWLGIRKNNDGTLSWANKEIESLDIEELMYVLGWAARVAKESKHSEVENDIVVYKSEEKNENIPNLDKLNMDEKLEMLAKKFGSEQKGKK